MLNMSNLELKGGILQMIATINDRDSLKELKELVEDFLGNHIQDTDYWDELSDTERSQLEKAITESKDESNHSSHEDVMIKYKQWLER